MYSKNFIIIILVRKGNAPAKINWTNVLDIASLAHSIYVGIRRWPDKNFLSVKQATPFNFGIQNLKSWICNFFENTLGFPYWISCSIICCFTPWWKMANKFHLKAREHHCAFTKKRKIFLNLDENRSITFSWWVFFSARSRLYWIFIKRKVLNSKSGFS